MIYYESPFKKGKAQLDNLALRIVIGHAYHVHDFPHASCKLFFKR